MYDHILLATKAAPTPITYFDIYEQGQLRYSHVTLQVFPTVNGVVRAVTADGKYVVFGVNFEARRVTPIATSNPAFKISTGVLLDSPGFRYFCVFPLSVLLAYFFTCRWAEGKIFPPSYRYVKEPKPNQLQPLTF
jgi:hypothetical protein